MSCVVVEILENLAYLANASNLVLYLKEYMHMSPSKSANNVTNFMGTSFLLALLGGFLSDAFLTTYHVYLISAVIELIVSLLIIITTFFYWYTNSIIVHYPSLGSFCYHLVTFSLFLFMSIPTCSFCYHAYMFLIFCFFLYKGLTMVN